MGLPCHVGAGARGESSTSVYGGGSAPLPPYIPLKRRIGGADSGSARLHADNGSSEREIGFTHKHTHTEQIWTEFPSPEGVEAVRL